MFDTETVRFKVNLNGDSKGVLVAQNINIQDAAEHLIAMLAEATPHGRNYQTFDDGNERAQQDRIRIGEMIEAARQIRDYAENQAVAALKD